MRSNQFSSNKHLAGKCQAGSVILGQIRRLMRLACRLSRCSPLGCRLSRLGALPFSRQLLVWCELGAFFTFF